MKDLSIESMFVVVIAMLLAFTLYLAWNNDAQNTKLEADAPIAREFATQHFNELDRDHSGIITKEELQEAQRDRHFSNRQHSLINLLETEIALAGHVIGSNKTSMPVVIYTSCGDGCMMPIITDSETTVNVYGISRDDLLDFPARVFRKLHGP